MICFGCSTALIPSAVHFVYGPGKGWYTATCPCCGLIMLTTNNVKSSFGRSRDNDKPNYKRTHKVRLG